MAIDPTTLETQRLALVKRDDGREEAKPCTRCGRRTRNKTGVCRRCQHEVPNMTMWHTDRVIDVIRAAEAELSRRGNQITQVLKGRRS